MIQAVTVAALVSSALWVLGCREAGPPGGSVLSYSPSAGARQSGATGLLGEPAPELRIGRWTDGDRPPPTLAGARGKVVVLYLFQGW